MARKFAELEAKMSPDSIARSSTRAKRTLELMALHEIRRARKKNQTEVAESMGSAQAEVSKIERRSDMRVSTLNDYIEALGGHLELRAIFPDGEVRVELTSNEAA